MFNSKKLTAILSLGLILVAGIAVMLAYGIISYLKIRRKTAESIKIKEEEIKNINKKSKTGYYDGFKYKIIEKNESTMFIFLDCAYANTSALFI